MIQTFSWLSRAFTAALCIVPTAVSADDISSFYAGKSMQMIVGYPPGGSNDIYARIVAQSLGRSIPGSPNIVTMNMAGAGSLAAANHLYNIAPKDGTIIGVISPGLPLQATLGLSGAKFQPSGLLWIGRTGAATNVTVVWHTSPIKTLEDVKQTEITLAATGVGSTIWLYPNVMNNVLKTKFKMILGYKGSPDTFLAMSRGETDGTNASWEALKAVHPDWIKEGMMRNLVQHGLNRNPELPDVPTSVELVKDPDDRAAMRIIMSSAELGKAYFTTPGVPNDRLNALRRAFDKMITDPKFVEDVAKISGEIAPMTGEQVQEIVAELDKMPPALLERVKSLYNPK